MICRTFGCKEKLTVNPSPSIASPPHPHTFQNKAGRGNAHQQEKQLKQTGGKEEGNQPPAALPQQAPPLATATPNQH